ncbi:MAG TPA: hypothetical protein VIU62_23095 [Chloroflexota bacterium]|jgi:hypothetical protein
MSAQELSLLDGRYQLIRQLSGPARTPLMVASDLTTGRVICVRLQRFTTALANLAAVPLLAAEPQPPGDGPLLPYDFGVDEGTSYLVREFVTATSLEHMLAAPNPPSPVDVVSVLRRAGDAMLTASAQGFCHPGLELRHVLVTTEGTVRVAGYDTIQPERRRSTAREGAVLAALLSPAFAGRITVAQRATAALPRPATHDPIRRLPPADSAEAVRVLLLHNQTWQATTAPDLRVVVRALRRCEEQLLGYSRTRELLKATSRAGAALFRRFRHLGPLLHPYVVVLALVLAVVILAARALSASANPGRLLVYSVPTRAADVPAAGYPFANPPQVAIVSTETTQATIVEPVPAATTVAALNNSPADAGMVSRAPVAPPVPPDQPVYRAPLVRQASAQPAIRSQAPTAPVSSAARTLASAPPRAPVAASAPVVTTATVIVTRLTAQQTTARVTVIGAMSTRSVAVAVTAAATMATVTRVTTASALHLAPTGVNVTATTTASKATPMVARSTVTRVVAILR